MSRAWRAFLRGLRRIDLQRWTWINFKFGMFMFALSVLIYQPASTATVNHLVALVWVYSAMFGAVISVAGIVWTAQPGDHARKYGTATELCGLILLGIGPLIYWIIMTAIVVTHEPGWEQRTGVMWFAYAMTAVVVARAMSIAPRYMREVRDMKVVKSHGLFSHRGD